jgi:putative ABC transport system permease protein
MDRPDVKTIDDGGAPARRAVIRWALRLLRREWRQQVLILALITVAVTATFIAAAVAVNAPQPVTANFGTAQDMATLNGPSSQVASQIAALRGNYGTVDVIENQSLPIPGSVETFSLRAQDPAGAFGRPMLGLVQGSYPKAAGEAAITSGLATRFHIGIGSSWHIAGLSLKVTGITENPQNLVDDFALVPPGQVTNPSQVTVLFNAPARQTREQIQQITRVVPGITNRGSADAANPINPETISLTAATLGMLLIALVGVGGFTVLAQRRLRSIGMLAAQGATAKHIRLVVRANGVATGVVGAVAGFLLGFAGWLIYRPTAQSSSHHVIGVFQLPWTVIGISMLLAIAASYFAAFRPAMAIARVPVVAALSGRPPAPKKTGRLAVPVGIAFLVAAFLLLGIAGAGTSSGNGMMAVVLGFVILIVAIVLLAPACLALVARLGRRFPVPVRLALRDLARYRARSGPALAAISVSTLIAVIICVVSAARFGNMLDYAGPNLTSSQLVVDIPRPDTGPDQPGPGSGTGVSGAGRGTPPPKPVTRATPQQAAAATDIAKSLGSTPVTLETTNAHLEHAAPGRSWAGPIYVATPQLLAAFGISQSQVQPDSLILTMRPGLDKLSLMHLIYNNDSAAARALPARGPDNPFACPPAACLKNPKIQEIGALPAGTSAPNTVITSNAIAALGLTSQVETSGWLIQAPKALTPGQIAGARQAAAAAGLSIETRNSIPSLSTIVDDATVFGIVLALGILGMSVGLVRSEASRDLRTLTATGASARTRRALVASTAFALAFTGAVIGLAGGYLAAIGFFRKNSLDGLSALSSVPVANLLLIGVGMPLFAGIVAWLLAGRDPRGVSSQPLE